MPAETRRAETVRSTISASTLVGQLQADFAISCPTCGGGLAIEDVVFAGMPIFAECSCPACRGRFMLDWPAGHALLHPTIVDAETGQAHFAGREWYPRVLLECLATRSAPVEVRIDVRAAPPQAPTALVANCLDDVYGHSLMKLLASIPYLKDEALDLVAIVPANLSWLVPHRARSVIEVDLPHSRARAWVAGLDAAVKQVLSGYERVRIAPAMSQPAVTASDLAELGPGFEPAPFWRRDKTAPPQITLVLREDRLWLGRAPALRKLTGSRLGGFVPARLRRRLQVGAQNRAYAGLVDRVSAAFPDARFVTVGFGRTLRLPDVVEDLRATALDAAGERAWCEEYARSDVVVGIHGSHLLLPSALAGGVVELLPREKTHNMTQDLIIVGESEREPKLSLFRYRILPESTAPDVVGDAVVSLLEDADLEHLNVIENRQVAPGGGWARPIVWRRLE